MPAVATLIRQSKGICQDKECAKNWGVLRGCPGLGLSSKAKNGTWWVLIILHIASRIWNGTFSFHNKILASIAPRLEWPEM